MTHEGKAVQKNTSISADDMCSHYFRLCGTGTRQTAFHTADASEWSAEDSYAQISCFFSKDAAVTKDYVIQLEQKLKTALQEASEDTSDVNGRTLVDCYSTKGELTLYSDRASITARAFGVGGDFFTFHPLKLLSGSYFDGEDLNKDGVVIDENVAMAVIWFQQCRRNVCGDQRSTVSGARCGKKR